MKKWYQTIIVNHKEEGKLSHWFDDENYKILCEERVEQLKEIERLHSIIKEVREYINDNLKGNEGHFHLNFEGNVFEILEILDKENMK